MSKIFAGLIVCAAIATAILLYEPKQQYIQLPAQEWMIDRISADLSELKQNKAYKTISLAKKLIDENSLKNIYIISIKDQKVSSYPLKLTKRASMIVSYLARMIKGGAQLPNIDFLLGDNDAWTFSQNINDEHINKLPPIFVFAASTEDKNRKNYILFPDDHTLGSHLIGYRKGWRRIYDEIKSKRALFPWQNKKQLAFWRGLPTDVKNDRSQSPRQKIVELSNKFPEKLDAIFTEVKFANTIVLKIFRPLMQMFSIYPYASYEEQLKYKMLPNLDGHSCTYPGILWRLLSGSLTLKQETANEQWFYSIVKPWQHYVPVDYDMNNIIERINWMNEHDHLALEIVNSAFNLVEEQLTPAHIDSYIVHLLEQYAEIAADNAELKLP